MVKETFVREQTVNLSELSAGIYYMTTTLGNAKLFKL